MGLGKLCALGILLAGLPGAGCRSEYRARLVSGDEVSFVRAIKGNDLVVRKGGEQARLRLVGVYAFDPNVMQKSELAAWARSAASFAQARAAGQSLRVVLEREQLDPRGRHLGFLEAGGADLGLLLVQEGHGAVYTEYAFSREAEYMEAEQRARSARRGLWGAPAATRRLQALRETWAAVRQREQGDAPADPLLATRSR